MKITDGEKLILLMLADIYDSKTPSGEIDTNFIRSSIYSNNLWALPWKFPGIPFEHTSDDPPVVSQVMDILEMWRLIEFSIARIPQNQRDALLSKFPNPKFPGFDGNNESEFMGTASFIVNQLERYTEFSDRSFNSHHPTLDGYARMLHRLRAIQKENHGPLSFEELYEILSAQQYARIDKPLT